MYRRALLLAAGFLVCVWAADGFARGGTPAGQHRVPQGQSNSALHMCIEQLRQTEAALKGADHDYGGHRVQAMEATHKAIEQLRTALKYEKGATNQRAGRGALAKAGGARRAAAGSVKGQPLPQAASDQVLEQGIAQLKAAKAELKGADHDYGGHRVASIAAIDHATAQLETALKFEKNRHKK
jgi:hypothetical protein